MQIGVAYHAERWPESSWAADAELMRKLGIEVVILGEFSWCRLEPRRDRFHFEWLANCIDTMARKGLKVILAAPQSAPPPWLLERHSTILPKDVEFKQWWMGGTGYVCLNSAPYGKYVRRLLQELSVRFKSSRSVCGWLLDSGPAAKYGLKCYCDDCVQAFRAWLKRRYGTIGRLNELWGTCFWGQEFTDWHEVPAPRKTPGGPMPAMQLDWRRFVSDATVAFLKEQKEIIGVSRDGASFSAAWAGGDLSDVDVFDMASVLDSISVDAGPLSGAPGELKNVIPLTGKPCRVYGLPAGLTHRQGRLGVARGRSQMRMGLVKSFAAGAELAAFSRWRTCPFGQEFYEEGLLDTDGRIRERFEEALKAVETVRSLTADLGGLRPRSEAAVMLDFEWLWAIESPALHKDLCGRDVLARFVETLRACGSGVDVIGTGSDLQPYKALILPFPAIADRILVEKLGAWVYGGGILALTALAGSRTAYNNRVDSAAPGVFCELAGLEVEALSGLDDVAVEVRGAAGEALGRAEVLCEKIGLKGAEPIARFDGGPFDGEPALSRNTSGGGKVFYIAAFPDSRLVSAITALLAADANLDILSSVPRGVELLPACDAQGNKVLVIANNSGLRVELALPARADHWVDRLTGRAFTGIIGLEAMEIVVLC